MAKLTRYTQKVFANAATNNGQFGSGVTGTKVTTNNLTTLQALPAFDNGWLDAVLSPQTLPPLEEMQGLQYIQTYQVAYLLQEGIPEYDSGTTYYANSIVKQPGTFNLYGSLTDNNLGNVLTDVTNWIFLQSLLNPIQVTMGFEATPTDRRLTFNGQTIAKTSGGTVNGTVYYRAYEYLWTNVSNTYAPVAGGRGLSATADFAANKTITIPDFTNMSPMQVGSIVNSAGRNNVGASTVLSTGSISINAITLSTSNLPPHQHFAFNSTNVGTTTAVNSSQYPAVSRQSVNDSDYQIQASSGSAAANVGLTSNTGGGSSFTPTGTFTGDATSVVHPVFGVYYYINY